MLLTSRPRGTADILPEEAGRWQRLEGLIRELCSLYGYGELRTPIFEHTELFQRGVGEATDIVEKEMYTFMDRGQRSITLRPEGTAPAVRAAQENKLLAGPLPLKVYYLGAMFRYDRPQAGRFRQFHQFGVEVFGSADPAADAEVIALALDFYGRLGLKGLELHLNSVGCPVCRPGHRQRLLAYLEPRREGLCPTCRARLERNPLRVLDCKNEACRKVAGEAPTTASSLCPECRKHFQEVRRYLELAELAYLVDERLVRGLDYYTGTTFEVMVEGIGAQNTIGAGGRYDRLVEDCGGPPTPGVGFGLGLERVLLTMQEQGLDLPGEEKKLRAFVATAGEEARDASFRLLQELRKAGVAAERDYLGRSLKAQLKHADRLGACFVVLLGEDELARGVATVRDMASGLQEEIPLAGLASYLYCQKTS